MANSIYDGAVWDTFNERLAELQPGGAVFPVVRVIGYMATNDEARRALSLLDAKLREHCSIEDTSDE